MDQAQAAFEVLKAYLSSHALLTSPRPGKTLLLSMATTPTAVNTASVREEDEHQGTIYYIIEAVTGLEDHLRSPNSLPKASPMLSGPCHHRVIDFSSK